MQMKISIWLIAGGFVMTAFSALALLGYIYGPCLEPFFFGYVVHIPQADQIYRGYVRKADNREVEVGCFRFHNLQKLAPAIPTKYSFDVEAKLSEKIHVSAYLADNHHFQSDDDLTTHRTGEKWDRSYCFEMPGTIADDQPIRVSGHAEHIRLLWGKRWPFWQSVTPVPEFVIRKETCYRNPPIDCTPLPK